jgi:hypothetical protein
MDEPDKNKTRIRKRDMLKRTWNSILKPPQMTITKIVPIISKSDESLEIKEQNIINFEIQQDESLCCICINNKKTYALVPCGHLCLCDNCSELKPELCPICRSETVSCIKIYS